METSPQIQFNEIVSDFERRLGDLRDAQQMMILQLETDKVVLKTQMEERASQLERERSEIANERRQIEAERAELKRVWAAVRQLNDMLSKGPVAMAIDETGDLDEVDFRIGDHSTNSSNANDETITDVESPAAEPSGEGQLLDDNSDGFDHDGWSVRYAA